MRENFRTLKHNQIINRIKKYDLFINCSYFEGFPNSVIEALSAGIPVLASQSHGGINEIINNKNFGNIYNNKNELLKFLNNFIFKKNKYKLNSNLITNHLNNFSLKKNISNYQKIFKKI